MTFSLKSWAVFGAVRSLVSFETVCMCLKSCHRSLNLIFIFAAPLLKLLAWESPTHDITSVLQFYIRGLNRKLVICKPFFCYKKKLKEKKLKKNR